MGVIAASSKRLILFFGAFAVSLGLSGTASAQALYYRSIPVGERAIGLGGAFTGVASDPSTTYYNPAGMARGGRFELLGSFSSIVFTRRSVNDGFEAPDAETNLSDKRARPLPRFIGTVVKLGRRKFNDDHQFSIGYSTLQVATNDFFDSYSSISEAATIDLRLGESYNDRWYGISFAADVSKKSAVGFSIFLSDQSRGYDENVGLASGGDYNPETQIRTGGDSATASSSIGVNSYQFVVRLGWLHRFSERLQFGVMFQAPGIPLKQKASVVVRTTTDVSPNESTFFLVDDSGLGARQPIPFELRAGMGWNLTPKTLVALDASITGPVPDRTVLDQPATLAQANRQLGAYFASSTERRWTPNVSIGIEHQFRAVVIAGGFYTNVSAAPNVPESSSEFTPEQVNLWGLACSVGVDASGYRFTVGASAQFGKGDALAVAIANDGTAIGYERTTASASALLLFIGGAISVATKTAKDLQQRRKEKKGEGAAEESGDSKSDKSSPAESPSADQSPLADQSPSTDSAAADDSEAAMAD